MKPSDILAMTDEEFARFLRRAGIEPARPGWSSRWHTLLGTLAALAVLTLCLFAILGVLVLASVMGPPA